MNLGQSRTAPGHPDGSGKQGQRADQAGSGHEEERRCLVGRGRRDRAVGTHENQSISACRRGGVRRAAGSQTSGCPKRSLGYGLVSYLEAVHHPIHRQLLSPVPRCLHDVTGAHMERLQAGQEGGSGALQLECRGHSVQCAGMQMAMQQGRGAGGCGNDRGASVLRTWRHDAIKAALPQLHQLVRSLYHLEGGLQPWSHLHGCSLAPIPFLQAGSLLSSQFKP